MRDKMFIATAFSAAGLSMAIAFGLAIAAVKAEETKVITLTQTGCQFIESENGVERGFHPKSGADCEKINGETGPQRLEAAKTLELAPGKYVFRVVNRDVPYELGFWLRDKDYEASNALAKLRKTSVSGGGLLPGKTKDYVVELKPGEYVYSCPLNPTPNYRLLVRG